MLGPLLVDLAGEDSEASMYAAIALSSPAYLAQAPQIAPAIITRLARIPPASPDHEDPTKDDAQILLSMVLVGAIGRIGYPALGTQPLLRKFLESSNSDVADAAAESLSLITPGPNPDVENLVRFALDHPDDRLCFLALENIGHNGARAVPLILSTWSMAIPESVATSSILSRLSALRRLHARASSPSTLPNIAGRLLIIWNSSPISARADWMS